MQAPLVPSAIDPVGVCFRPLAAFCETFLLSPVLVCVRVCVHVFVNDVYLSLFLSLFLSFSLSLSLSFSLSTHSHTSIYTYTYIGTYVPTYIHTYVHAYTHVCLCTHCRDNAYSEYIQVRFALAKSFKSCLEVFLVIVSRSIVVIGARCRVGTRDTHGLIIDAKH